MAEITQSTTILFSQFHQLVRWIRPRTENKANRNQACCLLKDVDETNDRRSDIILSHNVCNVLIDGFEDPVNAEAPKEHQFLQIKEENVGFNYAYNCNQKDMNAPRKIKERVCFFPLPCHNH